MFQSLLTSPEFACLIFSGLFFLVPASNIGSLKRDKDTKRETAGLERRLWVPSWGGAVQGSGSGGGPAAGAPQETGDQRPALPPPLDQPGPVN